MQTLSLPPFEYRFKKIGDKTAIFDVIRRKYIILTPEEWVRQHFVHFLIQAGYPKSLMRVESGHQINQLQKRTDVVIYSKTGTPFMLVECKAPSIEMNENVFRQTVIYNMTLKAHFIGITNGVKHFFAAHHEGQYTFLEKIPLWE